jgi:hypothetical protein
MKKEELVNQIIVELNYWDRISYTSVGSEIKRKENIGAYTDIGIFEKFYKMNNRLRYCNGSYYKFSTKDWQDKYNEWLKSDDYKQKSFNLYYGNGVVD